MTTGAPPARPEWGEHFRGRQTQSVEIALAVLEEVARAGAGVTAQQVCTRLGMPRSTGYRVIRQLVEAEWLARTPDISGLALGHRLSELVRGGAVTETPGEESPRSADHSAGGSGAV
ncbi:helix-turn-helix domain-containing protein [Microbacterium sp.]|uniref:helix-turn-helix domain-containing protein n=2 Tax=unclassified Microbacterium TaxID=2609290 RepID=UPI0025CCE1BA|nr:helix-turn-helix domain-containing protein [Microbacterium sp.]MBT9607139.1 helix-turn-helix domain-containing protein [Microbacterium sp.]